MRKKNIFIIAFLLLSIGCKREYEYSMACIQETKFVHWGRGYYKLRIFYEFEYSDSTCKGDDFTPGLYKIYGRKHYNEGDSVLVKFPKGKPNESERANNIIKTKKRKL